MTGFIPARTFVTNANSMTGRLMTDEELDRGIENGSIKVITKPTYGPDENGVARIIGETRRYEEQ